DRRGGNTREAVRHRRRRPAGQRDTGEDRAGAGGNMTSGDSLARAEELLARLESTRAELERLSQAEDAEKALEILGELADLSRAGRARAQLLARPRRSPGARQ